MPGRYTKTILKGYSASELQELAAGEGLRIADKTKKNVDPEAIVQPFWD